MIDARPSNYGALRSILALLGPDARVRETRKDRQFFARCPFHDDSTASLSLTMREHRGWVWNCFGCGESGDGIGFVMKAAKIDFHGAIKLVGAPDMQIPAIRERRKTYVLVCDACRDEWIGVDVEDLAWLNWEVAPDGIGAVGPQCLGERYETA